MHCGITNRFAALRLLALAAILMCGSSSLLAQTLTTLYLFGPGGNPEGALVEGADGNLYGTTYGYTGRGNGMIFKITPSGSFTELHGGGEFSAGLTLGTDGNFYGTSFAGGTGGNGFVFKITPSGTLTTLYTFSPNSGGIWTSGNLPRGLVQTSDGNFYGTTVYGGAHTCISGGTNFDGTIFKMTSTGTLTTLHSFDKTDGLYPTALVQHTNGTFYGTTISGGKISYHFCQAYCGSLFSLSVP